MKPTLFTVRPIRDADDAADRGLSDNEAAEIKTMPVMDTQKAKDMGLSAEFAKAMKCENTPVLVVQHTDGRLEIFRKETP